MKRYWGIAIAAAVLAAFVFSPVLTATYHVMYRELDNRPKMREVCANCPYTSICGATCGTSSAQCAEGSAIKETQDASPSATNPYHIIVYPGVYDECVALSNITDVTLEIKPGARIVPTVTSATSVAGGVIRIANAASGGGINRVTIINNGYVRNDAWSAPEAALEVGVETCTTSSEDWDNVTISGSGYFIGAHDGIHVCGDRNTSNGTTGLPHISISNVHAISGADAIVKKGGSHMVVRNVYALSQTNYCETTDTTITAQLTGTVVTTGADTTHFTLASDEPTTTDSLNGRHGVLSGAACNGGVNVHFWITDYTSARLVTTTALGFTPDTNCTYTIDAVTGAADAPCKDVDWSVYRDYWKNTAFHFGALVTQTTMPDLDFTRVVDSLLEVELNDFGGLNNSSTKCIGQQTATGVLSYTDTAEWQKAVFDNVTINVTSNVILRAAQPDGTSDDNACLYPLTAIAMLGEFEDSATFSHVTARVYNTADINATVYGIAVADAGTFRFPDSTVEVSNTVGSYVGTTAPLIQSVGTVYCPRQVCAIIPDLADTDDSYEFYQFFRAGAVCSVGCRCRGTCSSTLATFQLEDRAGNAMTSGPTCATSGNATYTAITAGQAVVQGEGLAFDVTNTPTNNGVDEYTICATYIDAPQ